MTVAGVPDIRVNVYFDFPWQPDAFTLNDPVRGVLDGTTYKLYASTPVDVYDDAVSVVINRGNMDTQLIPGVQAGSATVVLNNDDTSVNGARTYDPLHSASPYFGNIIPNRRVVVTANGEPLFDGKIADWDFNYETDGRSTAAIIAADGLATIAGQEFDDWTATAGQTAGPRISDVLDRAEVQWPYARDIDTGVSTLQGDTVSFGTNVLQYLTTVTQSDLGLLYVSRSGTLTFRDRHAALNAAAAVVFADTAAVGVPYRSVVTSYGRDLLFNRVGVQASGFGPATVIDAPSQSFYGPKSYTTPTLLLNSSLQMLNMANFLAGTYANPEYRVKGLTVDVGALPADQQMEVITLDIGSVVQVVFTPNHVGDPITRNAMVIGIRDEINPARHTRTLSLQDIDRRSFFQLDDSAFGVLDASLVAF